MESLIGAFVTIQIDKLPQKDEIKCCGEIRDGKFCSECGKELSKIPLEENENYYTNLIEKVTDSFAFRVEVIDNYIIIFNEETLCDVIKEHDVFEFDVIEYSTEIQEFTNNYKDELKKLVAFLGSSIDVKFGVINL